jgi:response regulator RpfG family c-di-GMP phosphodiesterase
MVAVHPETRLLFMSGHAGGAATQKGVAASRATLLQKPFSRELLLRKVHEAIHLPRESELPVNVHSGQ